MYRKMYMHMDIFSCFYSYETWIIPKHIMLQSTSVTLKFIMDSEGSQDETIEKFLN